jgi:WhiB family transcriptional regulator, redox-sensing transcriptional regulator
VRDTGWMQQAACHGHDYRRWFPTGVQEPDELALALCSRCPVAACCLDYSFGAPGGRVEAGVWGGLTEDERQAERRRRQRRTGATG